MKNILIDTNVYLEFFQSNKIAQLLPAISKCADNILITTQIVNELRRNQLSVATQFLKNSYPLKEPKFGLPHLVADDDALQKRVDDFNKESKLLTQELQGKYRRTLDEIADGSHGTVKNLEKVLANAVSPTAEELQRAQNRKLLGNPPGKQSDPLGDQITWEQFLAQIGGSKRIWIITKDNDYCEEILSSDTPTLNPFLKHEVAEKCGPEVEVYCFRTLADGLKSFVETTKVSESQLPEPQVLKQIAQEEQNLAPNPFLWGEPPPPQCPNCGSKQSFDPGAYLRSRYGGLTLQYICYVCGFHYDTGEFFD